MKEQILKLRSEGKTYTEIKEILKCSKGTISFYCGEGQKEKYRINNLRAKSRKREWIDSIKATLKCINCGEARWWVLDFHHRDPKTKDKGVAALIQTGSRERVLNEIEKCDVLCSNCHRDLHYRETI